MRKNRFGIPVFHSTDKLLKHVRENKDMGDNTYNDEHYGISVARYDGELIDIDDAHNRYKRDKKIREKNEEAEQNRDILQLSWDEVKTRLS